MDAATVLRTTQSQYTDDRKSRNDVKNDVCMSVYGDRLCYVNTKRKLNSLPKLSVSNRIMDLVAFFFHRSYSFFFFFSFFMCAHVHSRSLLYFRFIVVNVNERMHTWKKNDCAYACVLNVLFSHLRSTNIAKMFVFVCSMLCQDAGPLYSKVCMYVLEWAQVAWKWQRKQWQKMKETLAGVRRLISSVHI